MRFISFRLLRISAAIFASVLVFAGMDARAAVDVTFVRSNITMYAGRTFQMPVNGFDDQGLPLSFFVASIHPNKVTGVFAPYSNHNLLLNVSGVDSNNAPFTGDLELQLYEDLTPVIAARIIDLVNSNFYNGLTFHRVIAGLIAQGGDPNGNGTGGSGVTLDDEFATNLTFNGFGQLAMANSGPDSNDSQFFITDPGLTLSTTNTPLPASSYSFVYSLFGQMTRGFDVLGKILGTPVNASNNDRPLSNVVINAASIVSDPSNVVLRLTAAKGFKGTAIVTVRVENEDGDWATRDLRVNVIPDPNNYPPVMGPVPSSLVVTQNEAATFISRPVDIDGDAVNFNLKDATTGNFPTNLTAAVNPKTFRFWFSPDVTFTGMENMVLEVTDNRHNADSQHFSLTVLPWSATPTMTIVPLKGIMMDVAKTNGDHISVSGTFAFNGQSDHTFSSNDVVVLNLGNPTNALTARLTPDLTGFKFSKGVLTAKGQVIVGSSSGVNVSAQFNSVKSNFTISVSHFSFPAPLTNQIEVGVAIGNDYGSNVTTWVEKSPGSFVPPAAP